MSTTSEEEEALEEEAPARRFQPPPLPWVLFAIAFAMALVFYFFWQGEKADARRRQDVRATATQFLQALTNFKGSTIDKDVAEIRSFAVGDFAGEVDALFNQEMTQLLRDADVTSEGVVTEGNVFVQSVEGSVAEVFGLVDETVINPSCSGPLRATVRADVSLIETSDGWKISGLEILQSPDEPTFSVTCE